MGGRALTYVCVQVGDLVVNVGKNIKLVHQPAFIICTMSQPFNFIGMAPPAQS